MKKSSKIILVGALAIAALAIVYRAVNRTPDLSLPANEQITQILNDGGCAFCHTANPDLPFYASWPVASSMIEAHVGEGYKMFDIEPMMTAIAEGKAVGEVDLAKVEKCIADGTMPLASYYLAHWGSSLTSSKTEMALEWVKAHRQQFYPNELAAEEFKNEPVRPIPDSVAVDPAKVLLGKALYHDTRLSGDNTISCAATTSKQPASTTISSLTVLVASLVVSMLQRRIMQCSTSYSSGMAVQLPLLNKQPVLH